MKLKVEPDLLDWTAGKVKGFFSKELLNLDAGTFKLIKIAPYAAYPEHIHPNKIEYAYAIEGTPEFIINNEHYKSKPGDFFIFPQNIKHSISNPAIVECSILVGAIKNAG